MKKTEFWAKEYQRNIGKMVGVCYHYVGDWQLAEDLAQDAFLTAMEKANTYHAWGSFERWLRKIAVNEALMYLRDRPEMVEADDSLPDQTEEITEETTAMTEFTQEDFEEVIRKLDVKQRTVFNLYAVEHCSHKRIAELLNISVNNSKVLLNRARAELQQRLKVVARKRELGVGSSRRPLGVRAKRCI